jgi:hypothetical protein
MATTTISSTIVKPARTLGAVNSWELINTIRQWLESEGWSTMPIPYRGTACRDPYCNPRAKQLARSFAAQSRRTSWTQQPDCRLSPTD